MSSFDDAISEYVSVMGKPMPELMFPAVITGVAKPQHTTAGRWPGASLQLESPQPTCTDPSGYMDCSYADTPDSDGFYPDTFLPCGVWPARYRWRAEFGNATSECCGWRKTGSDPDVWAPWAQQYYAVNTAHTTQDTALDYPFIRPGTLVIMQFSALAGITDGYGGPLYGFSFHHMNDPLGTIVPCPIPGPGEVTGCCQYYDPTMPGGLHILCCDCDVCYLLAMEYGQPPFMCVPTENCVVGDNCY